MVHVINITNFKYKRSNKIFYLPLTLSSILTLQLGSLDVFQENLNVYYAITHNQVLMSHHRNNITCVFDSTPFFSKIFFNIINEKLLLLFIWQGTKLLSQSRPYTIFFFELQIDLHYYNLQ